MGLDLTLLPFTHDFESDWAFSHVLLPCDRSAVIHEIRDLPSQPVPKRFDSYLGLGDDGEHRYGNTQKTPYGSQLTYVLVDDLLKFSTHEDVVSMRENRAAWAYLKELRSGTKVALYWC